MGDEAVGWEVPSTVTAGSSTASLAGAAGVAPAEEGSAVWALMEPATRSDGKNARVLAKGLKPEGRVSVCGEDEVAGEAAEDMGEGV